MGYPMTYGRVVKRNRLEGGYETPNPPGNMPMAHISIDAQFGLIRGDLRRLEQDQRDVVHLAQYARRVGCTAEQAKAILDAFFEGLF